MKLIFTIEETTGGHIHVQCGADGMEKASAREQAFGHAIAEHFKTALPEISDDLGGGGGFVIEGDRRKN